MRLKFLVIIVSVLVLISCGVSENYSFQEKNVSFKLKFKDNHWVDKMVYDDKRYHYDIIFLGNRKDELISVYIEDKSIKEMYSNRDCKVVFEKERNLYFVECGESGTGNYFESFYIEKKIKNKYIVFRPYKDNINSENIEFLLKKIDQIVIIEK
ncbi:hypothetical protein [Flavobacterium urocaniciphilum]|uniref:Lipoprotein n=1 Tax=Flavobacterium urocaniciphilum TaxID=1299341 RepID=A0A1H9CY76_9FLAO|nr:hypothetical protein [Flavobacterium urocaniciphilum]SEQ06206.1 hypothetical protein SAMN05444005_105158 [Flavobacterium urocaniciphilum]